MQVPFSLLALLLCFGTLCSGNQLLLETIPLKIGSNHEVKPGPWGPLTYEPIILQPTREYTAQSIDMRNWARGTVWDFEAGTKENVIDILIDAGIDPETASKLCSASFCRFDPVKSIARIVPPGETIVSLTDQQRQKLYPQLLPKDDTNPFHNPYSLPWEGLEISLQMPTTVNPAQVEYIRNLSYSRGSTRAFSDVNFLLATCENDEQRLDLLRFICRQRSVDLKLEIPVDSNPEELIQYWSARGRNPEVVQLIRSVLSNESITHLDVIHLLPPLPRRFLHLFPSPDYEGFSDASPDCFWTAFNFFAEQPSERYFAYIDHVLAERYFRSGPNQLEFGDLILFIDKKSGKKVHACNYIASNLVFTKNGRSLYRPWIITSLNDVVETYLETDISLTFYRLKSAYLK